MSGHTPGPWTVEQPAVDRKQWFRIIAPSPIVEDLLQVIANVQIRTNARLIAAAPDLLEAARDVAHLIPGAHKRLKAAIAKAEGK